jgi:hypothetical protein
MDFISSSKNGNRVGHFFYLLNSLCIGFFLFQGKKNFGHIKNSLKGYCFKNKNIFRYKNLRTYSSFNFAKIILPADV